MKRLIIFIVAILLFGCSSKKEKATANSDSYYTCSMHPQVMQPNPGKCPICHMSLIKVQKSKGPKADEIQLSDQQIQFGNIHYDTIRSGSVGDEIVLTATLNFDQMKTKSVSAIVMGRIERLYFKNVGDYVAKGQKLFEIYSEELNNAKQEYIMNLERKRTLDNSIIDFDQLIQSSRNKLILWGMSQSQINELASLKKAPLTTAYFTPESGHITSLEIREGDYAMEGGTIVKLANLSSLWAEAQVYTSQLTQIDQGGAAVVQIPDLAGKEFNGRIEFVNPEINPATRINLVRVTIPNTGNQLKPGMPAYVLIKNRQRNALTLPIDAVIRDAKGATVWIKTGANTFKSKMVITGLESEDRIEITSGLSTGDVIVVKGAYLINSEYIFKHGADPMAGHKM